MSNPFDTCLERPKNGMSKHFDTSNHYLKQNIQKPSPIIRTELFCTINTQISFKIELLRFVLSNNLVRHKYNRNNHKNNHSYTNTRKSFFFLFHNIHLFFTPFFYFCYIFIFRNAFCFF